MEEKTDFYIGWQDQAPAAYATSAKRFVYLLALALPLVAALLVLTQRGFAPSVFEFGTLTEIEGFLSTDPVPRLRIIQGQDALGQNSYSSVLLVGFGKTSAETDLAQWQAQHGEQLFQRPVQLRGTLIYHDGKAMLELSEGQAAFVGFSAESKSPQAVVPQALGSVKLRGEIYDPKCALGVMKPGYGKPHRSCAVRCISGGVPPILRVANAAGQANYFILRDRTGAALHAEVLDYVGDQVQICGRLEQQDDWLILYTDPARDILRLQPHWMEADIRLCSQN